MTPKEKQILSVMAAVAILAGGYVWATKYRQNLSPLPNPPPQGEGKEKNNSSPSEGGGGVGVNEDDQTANWKTYRNDKFGFEVRYPDAWKLDNVTEDQLLMLAFFDEQQSASVGVWDTEPQGKVLLAQQATTREQITVGGVKTTAYIFPTGYECYGVNPTPDQCYQQVIYFKKDAYWFTIDTFGKKPVDPNQILSTFKFTK